MTDNDDELDPVELSRRFTTLQPRRDLPRDPDDPVELARRFNRHNRTPEVPR